MMMNDLVRELEEARQWRIKAGLKWKSARERSLESQIAAHRRLAAEEQEMEREAHANAVARLIVADADPNWVRAGRDKERNDPDRMPCCGAPKDGSEPSPKYARRHYKSVDLKKPTDPCVPARQCDNLYRNQDSKGEVRQKERGLDRMPCCGAPTAGDETTDRFYLRHRNGAFGLIPGKPCLPAAKCRTLYNRIIGANRRLRERLSG